MLRRVAVLWATIKSAKLTAFLVIQIKRKEEAMGKISPSISAVLEKYKKIAGVQRLRTGKPEPKTVDNAIGSVRRLCELGSINLDEPINVFTQRKLTRILDPAIAAKLKAVTI